MQLVALGVGNAFTARYHSTCGVVEAAGERLMIDCPHPIRRVLADAEAGFDVGDLLGVVVTHLHADHVSGLEGLLYFAHFVMGRKLRLLAHPDVLADLWDGHLRAGMQRLLLPDGTYQALSLPDVADVVPLDEAAPTPVGPFRIACRRTRHHIPTFALRIEAEGRTLGWSADTAFDPSLIAWLGQADRFVHEVTTEAAAAAVHTPYADLAALPADVRAKMWLNHYPDDFDLEASVVPCLRQGARYPVEPPAGA